MQNPERNAGPKLIDTDLDVEIFAAPDPAQKERVLIDTDLDVEIYSDGTKDDARLQPVTDSHQSSRT